MLRRPVSFVVPTWLRNLPRQIARLWHRYWQPMGIAVGIVAGALAITVVMWDWPPTGLDDDKRTDVVRTLGLVIGGGLALVVAVWRGKTAQSEADRGERDLLNRQFDNSLSLLSRQDVVDRLSGIHRLGQLAEQHPSLFRDDVVRVLCAFARHPTIVQETSDDPVIPLPRHLGDDALVTAKNYRRREEIESTVRVISSCNSAAQSDLPPERLTIDLSGIELYEVDFSRINLSNANLESAHLPRAKLNGANLSGANLTFADLRSADVTRANLSGANLIFADFRQAQLSWANLGGADLPYAQMSEVDIDFTNVSGAKFSFGQDEGHLANLVPRLIEDTAASGITQLMVDQTWAEDGNPPKLNGILDAETGVPLEWRGGSPLPQGLTRWPYD